MATPLFPAATARPTEPAGDGLRLHVRGFAGERQLLQGAVMLSQRRAPRLFLLDEAQADGADVLMVDGRDAAALRWAAGARWLARKPVIWVDAPAGAPVAPGHVQVSRPVQWPILPMMLFRALESRPQAAPAPAPAVPAAAGPSAQAAPRARGDLRQVLVVDDSLAVRSYLRSVLEPRCLRVAEADSGEAALAALDAGPVDCVLMDVLMPGMDGFEACRRIKAAGRQAPPVVMLTSKSSPFNLVRGKMAGCDAYLTKPVDPHQLFDTLQAYVSVDLQPSVPAALAA